MDDTWWCCYGLLWFYMMIYNICVLMVYSTHISLYIVLGIEFGSFNLGLTFASLSCSRTGIHLRRSKRCVFHGFWWSTRTIRFTRIAIENGRLSSLIYLLKLVIFHICLSLPEGIPLFSHKCWYWSHPPNTKHPHSMVANKWFHPPLNHGVWEVLNLVLKNGGWAYPMIKPWLSPLNQSDPTVARRSPSWSLGPFRWVASLSLRTPGICTPNEVLNTGNIEK